MKILVESYLTKNFIFLWQMNFWRQRRSRDTLCMQKEVKLQIHTVFEFNSTVYK